MGKYLVIYSIYIVNGDSLFYINIKYVGNKLWLDFLIKDRENLYIRGFILYRIK